jgi:DNA-binding FadR family transcriptional regulator
LPGDPAIVGLDKVVNRYRRLILTGRIPEGDPLPSSEELQLEYGLTESETSAFYERLKALGLAAKGRHP